MLDISHSRFRNSLVRDGPLVVRSNGRRLGRRACVSRPTGFWALHIAKIWRLAWQYLGLIQRRFRCPLLQRWEALSPSSPIVRSLQPLSFDYLVDAEAGPAELLLRVPLLHDASCGSVLALASRDLFPMVQRGIMLDLTLCVVI